MKLFFSFVILLVSAFSVFPQREMSDREVEGLKGKVQSVFEEESDFVLKNGKYVETKKVPSDEMKFDENGAFLTRNLYSEGKIFIERKYDYLDGERISIEKTFYGKDAILAPPGARQQNEPRDNRYSFKFKYKFDDKGRRTEEEWYNNTGKLWIRDVRKYDEKGNEIEWYRYSSNGEVNMKSISEFDAKGNVVKTTYPSQTVTDKVESYTYEYVFDAQGNWVKRISKKLTTRNGKSEFLPYQVNYRKLIYFNQN